MSRKNIMLLLIFIVIIFNAIIAQNILMLAYESKDVVLFIRHTVFANNTTVWMATFVLVSLLYKE